MRIHSWFKPSSGVNRFSGSHSRHLAIRFTNSGSGTSLSLVMIYLSRSSFSLSFKTSDPFAAGTAVLSSLNYVNMSFRVDLWSTESLGFPITSITSCICSRSFVPGNKGKPVKSSISMQPNDHISIYSV